ncbi:hypothetical protein MNB_SM-7-1386 [hydrothermal vent metagenome]|uniref:Uncharacterized protein n=1 Tax=hydrothermal vent metagenome TaxID=652676 RepID=A0A1W1BZ66_9ZZZZ
MRSLMVLAFFSIMLFAKEPVWIKDPTINGRYIGAIGCAKDINNTKLQEKMALLRAKGAISQQIQTEVKDTIEKNTTVDGDIFSEEFGFHTDQKSATTFSIQKMDSYRYSDGLLCVWVVKK